MQGPTQFQSDVNFRGFISASPDARHARNGWVRCTMMACDQRSLRRRVNGTSSPKRGDRQRPLLPGPTLGSAEHPGAARWFAQTTERRHPNPCKPKVELQRLVRGGGCRVRHRGHPAPRPRRAMRAPVSWLQHFFDETAGAIFSLSRVAPQPPLRPKAASTNASFPCDLALDPRRTGPESATGRCPNRWLAQAPRARSNTGGPISPRTRITLLSLTRASTLGPHHQVSVHALPTATRGGRHAQRAIPETTTSTRREVPKRRRGTRTPTPGQPPAKASRCQSTWGRRIVTTSRGLPSTARATAAFRQTPARGRSSTRTGR